MTALVSGADSGIGVNAAKILSNEGATGVIVDKDQGELDEVASKLAGILRLRKPALYVRAT